MFKAATRDETVHSNCISRLHKLGELVQWEVYGWVSGLNSDTKPNNAAIS
jgi:hypothetical protein